MKYTTPRQTVICDTETYPNYWAIAFRDVATGKMRRLERTPTQELDIETLRGFLQRTRIITFNGSGYDIPMIMLAMTGTTNERLKVANDKIITSGVRSWQFLDMYGLRIPSYLDHIDLMEVSPGSPTKPSLKVYAGRLHSKSMIDLPYDPDKPLTPEEIDVLREYHEHDLIVTQELYEELKAQCDIRAEMSDQYGLDLRSKSDAQIAEAVIRAEVEKQLGRKVEKPTVVAHTFRYDPPPFLKFRTPEMQRVFEMICATDFVVDDRGIVTMPKELADLAICFAPGTSKYQMGLGGLHSQESSVSHYADESMLLIDRDVTSYYPNIMLGTGLFPPNMGEAFAIVFRSIYERRLAAKDGGLANIAETLKIVLNGTFGKLGSPYAIIYAVKLMIQTTIGGQLMMLMNIEKMFLDGFEVISANTDGFVTKVPTHRVDEFNANIKAWEETTGLRTEDTEYRAVHSRDVNSYIAIMKKYDKQKKVWLDEFGGCKLKGAFSPSGRGMKGAAGLKKNPNCDISTKAVVAYLSKGVPISETIRGCTDVRQFVAVRRVTGGAMYKGELVGKVIRVYYAQGAEGALTYKVNGYTVPKTEGAKPLMTLPDELPADIDYEWYEREATAILRDVGIKVIDPKLAGRTGKMLAIAPGQKTPHVVLLPEGIALCGKRLGSLREEWQEGVSDGARMCAQCKKVKDLF